MIYFWVALAIIDILIIFFFILLCMISLRHAPADIRKQVFRPGSQLERLQQAILTDEVFFQAHPSEPLTIESSGITLAALRFPRENPNGRIILFHGYRSIAETDFACVMEFYFSRGYELVLVDQRAHGKSGGNWIGFGVLERKDCLRWIRFLNEKYQSLPTFLSGISMGASTVLMALGEELPKNICGAIADCGFTSPKEIIRHVMKDKMHLPSSLLMPILSFFSKVFCGYSFDEYSTIHAMKKTKIPILFIHGKDDHYVPAAMTLENYAACRSPKELILVEGAGHGTSYLQDKETVERTIDAFLKRWNPAK